MSKLFFSNLIWFLLVTLAFLSISFICSAQQVMNFVAPAGYKKVMETRGDLDKNGTAEVVYVYNTDKANGENGFFRVLYICKVVDGKETLWKENRSVLRSSRECGFCVDEGIDLGVEIKNNTLIISQTFNHNTRHYSTNKDIFRYQNMGWFLIGSTFREFDTCEYDYTYDINFSTKQVSAAFTYGDCDEGKEIPKNRLYDFKYPFKGLVRMDSFKPGQVELKIPNSKSYFYY